MKVKAVVRELTILPHLMPRSIEIIDPRCLNTSARINCAFEVAKVEYTFRHAETIQHDPWSEMAIDRTVKEKLVI